MSEASCSCGGLRVTCDGEPDLVSLCHCLACQRRTGSAFGVQAWYPRDRVSVPAAASRYSRQGASGRSVQFHFCSTCGGTVFWHADTMPDLVAVAVGCFADPAFPGPDRSIWERRQHPWTNRLQDAVKQHRE